MNATSNPTRWYRCDRCARHRLLSRSPIVAAIRFRTRGYDAGTFADLACGHTIRVSEEDAR